MVKQTSFRTIIIGIETTTEFFGGKERLNLTLNTAGRSGDLHPRNSVEAADGNLP